MKTFLHILFFLCWLVIAKNASGQIVLSGGYININGGGYVVVGNPNPNGIIRNSGAIISEGQNNQVKWLIGTTTGTYTVPLAYGSEYLPITFTKTAGNGSNGYIAISTYSTGWQNSAMLPTGVDNVNRNGTDYSSYTIDRFWGIDASSYTGKPNMTNVIFTYRDAEVTASGNFIVENELIPQRWNPNISDWKDYHPGVTVNTSNNTLTIATLNGNNLYRWWTMASGALHALPVELTEFKGECDHGIKTISWITASEWNSASFVLESSTDAINWNLVKALPAAGNSNRTLSYSVTDEGNGNYYRLTQLDIGGRSHVFDIININCNGRQIAQFEIYPNPSSGQFYMRNIPENSTIEVFDPLGQIVHTERTGLADANVDLSGMSKGMYMIVLRAGQKTITNKLMIQ